ASASHTLSLHDALPILAGMGPASVLNFEGMVLGHVELHTCNYNWKTFIEVYLEDYHVEPFHPGLGNFVTCDDLRWEFKPEFSVQDRKSTRLNSSHVKIS